MKSYCGGLTAKLLLTARLSSCEITAYNLEELPGTQLKALY